MTCRTSVPNDSVALADRNVDVQLRLSAERSAREARALAEIVQQINQSLELDRVFALIARHAAELLRARGSRLWMLDGEQVVLVGGFDPGIENGTRVPLPVTFVGECIRTRLPAQSRDLAAERLRWPWSAANVIRDATEAIAAPLLIANRVLGAIQVFGEEGRGFDGHDEELLLALANHAAVAIENARLYHASVRTMRHASVLAASASRLAHNVTPDAMYADIGRVARTALGADGVVIYLADPAGGEVRLAFAEDAACGDEVAPTLADFWGTAAGDVVRAGRPGFRRDLREFEQEPAVAALLDRSVSSLALLPLIVEGRPRGLLSLRFLRMQPFDPEQRRLLTDFSTHAAVAVRNALLFADLERTASANARLFEAERCERQQAEAAAGIARATLRAATTEEAATLVLRILQPVAPSSGSALAVVAPGGQGLRCIAAQGTAAALSGAVLPFRDEERGIDTRVVRDDATGNPSSIVLTHPALEEPLTVVPLSSGSHPIGALLVTPAKDPRLARTQSATLERLAASVALALDTMLLREEDRRVAEQLRQSEKLAALGELVAGVAHEVNNPLTGISAFAQLLQEDPLSADQLESVQLIKREADRAVAVIRDLLTFARKTGPRNVPVDLNDLIEQTLRLRAYGIRTSGVTVTTTLDPDLHMVQGDDRQLQQVLLNLVVNAEHAVAAARRRELSIRTINEADRVMVEVSDSGAGMSPELQKRIFEPFFTTKPEGKGTGLGLSVSYGIVQTHNGTLTVQSAPGSGSVFRISLPAALPPDTSSSSGPA